MRILMFLLLALTSVSLRAEVFKCIEKYGRITYQNTPCKSSAKEQQLDIKSDPAKEAEAKAKLEAIRNEYETRKALKAEEEKILRSRRSEALSLEFARRNAIAQQEQAHAQQRQAEALERSTPYNNRPLYYWPGSRPLPAPNLFNDPTGSRLNPPVPPTPLQTRPQR